MTEQEQEQFAKLVRIAREDPEVRHDGEAVIVAKVAVAASQDPHFEESFNAVLEGGECQNVDEAIEVAKLVSIAVSDKRKRFFSEAIDAFDASIKRLRQDNESKLLSLEGKTSLATLRVREHEHGIRLAVNEARAAGKRQGEAIRLAVEGGCEPSAISAAFSL